MIYGTYDNGKSMRKAGMNDYSLETVKSTRGFPMVLGEGGSAVLLTKVRNVF